MASVSTGLRNTLAIVCFVIALFWAMAHAPEGRGVTSRAAVCKVFKSRCGAAWRVVMCESRGNPRAVGGAGERGLFQIHPVHFRWAKPEKLFEPRWNALVAYRLSRGGTNWGPWTCRWAA